MGARMRETALAGALLAILGLAQAELECAHPARSRTLIDRLRLAELEYAEDLHREAFWSALGRCPGEPAGAACRAREQGNFDARWREQRAHIDAKYRKMHEDFEVRCQASIS